MHNRIVFALWILVQAATAQELPKTVRFEQLSLPGSVQSSEITDVVQDPEGLLWIAGNGLFRYDGSFTRYTLLPDSSILAGKEINSLFYDTVKKRLLIATRNHGVVEFNYSTNSLRKLAARDGTPILNAFTQTTDGRVWASSFGSGIFYLENDTLKKLQLKKFDRTSTTALHTLGNQLLIGGAQKVFMLEHNQVTDSIVLAWPDKNFSYLGHITTITFDGKRNLYIGTEKEGLMVYDLQQKKFVKYFAPGVSPFFNRINKVFIDRDGLVWILTKSGGLVLYHPGEDRYITLTKNPFSPESLSGDNCTSILQDKTGMIWIGATGGLNKYDPNKVQFTHITHNPFDKNSLTDKMVRGIFEDDRGRLLIGTDGGYINRLTLPTQTLEHLKITLPGRTGVIVPMYFTDFDRNTLLIGTNVGVLQMDKRTNVFSPYKPLAQLDNKMVRQIIRHQHKLYMLSQSALYIHDLNDQSTVRFGNFSDQPETEVGNLTCIFIDSNDRVWLGVQGGVARLREDQTFAYYQFEKDEGRPAGSYFMVLTLAEIDGKLWVGTFDSGLWQMDISNGLGRSSIVRLGTLDDRINNTIYSTLRSDDGAVWISTNQGILKFEPAQRQITEFTISEGLQDREFNRLAYCKTTSGIFVFGGINGINLFDPLKIKITAAIPQPAIVSLSGHEAGENNFYFDLRDQPSIQLPAYRNNLTFTFLVPNYQQPARFETAYLLENHDVRWQPALNNQATYTKLKPGQYTFNVRVKNQDGVEHISSVSVWIQYPFWQTWWFMALALLAVILLTFILIRVFTVKALRDKMRLEALLSERTREIENSRSELEKLNKKKDLIFSILSHDLRGPLTTLKGFLSLIVNNIDSMGKEDIKAHASHIRNSVVNSLDLIDNTLFWSLSQTGTITYTPSHFLLNDVLHKIFNLYQFTADKKHIKLHLQTEEKIEVFADENMVYVALRNLVSNALKFTDARKNVYIEAKRNHQFGVVKISDEGIGMSQAYINELLAEEEPAIKMSTSNEKGTGLGLILCRKFIEMNKGMLQVNSIEKSGTDVTISIPLYDEPRG